MLSVNHGQKYWRGGRERRGYHGGEGGDAGHEGGGGGPSAAGEDAVDGGDGERPEEGELEAEEAVEEGRRVGHEVVVELGGVPPLEVPQRRRVEVGREDGLRVDERDRHRDDEGEEDDHRVRHRRDDAHRFCRACLVLVVGA
uniref:Uncharacterized protein n=1 Tax=Triticum urartu TaxID=4572 RepID=A0A8R7QM32_TRIUA